MAQFKNFMNGAGNILYNNIAQIPFSAARGLSWVHFLPSHVNYGMQMKKCGFIEKVDPEVANPFWEINEEKMKSQPMKKRMFEGHYYNKISHLGDNLMRLEPKSESGMELVLSVVPQLILSTISGLGATGLYVQAVDKYGPKALIPIVITTGLSLANELEFNKKLKGLENRLGFFKG
jgi:hypothetical protein